MPPAAARPLLRRSAAGLLSGVLLVLLAGPVAAQASPEPDGAVQESPSPAPSGLVPLPSEDGEPPQDEPTEEPSGKPPQEPRTLAPQPVRTTTAPTRRARRSSAPAPRLQPTPERSPTRSALPTTGSPEPTSLPTAPTPLDVGRPQDGPTSTPAAVGDAGDAPTDPVTRGLRLALLGALLLGAAGVTGLYLTRETT